MIQNINVISNNELISYKIDTGIKGYGWETLMSISGGFNPGELIVLAGRPGKGKTTLAINFAVFASKMAPVLFESLEMTAIEIKNRIGKFVNNINKLKQIYINDDSRLSMEDLELDILRTKAKFVFIDYLSLMQGNIRKLTKELKLLAKKTNTIIFLLCQLNRKAENKKPDLSMLKDSGNIEADANQVWFIDDAEIIIAKNRKGATGSIYINFLRDSFLIVEDKEREETDQRIMELYHKALNTKSDLKFWFITRKIKKLDPTFYNKHFTKGNILTTIMEI